MRAGIVVSALVLGLWLLWSVVSGSADTPSSNPAEPPSPAKISEAVAAPLPFESRPLNRRDAELCRAYVRDHGELKYQWARETYPQWTAYLEQGYSLDEVTLAVQFLTNSNFASSFRLAFLRENTRLVSAEREINGREEMVQARRQMPGLRLTLRVPNTMLEEFDTLSPEQQRQRLEQVAPSVDDMAYFLGQQALDSQGVMLLLETVKDPAEVVGDDARPALSLLDLAAMHGRLEAVEFLLKSGVAVSSDPYLATSLDWALQRLFFQGENTDPRQIAIIELLLGAGAQSSIQAGPSGELRWSFPRRYYYEFKPDFQQRLLMDYGLDLESLPRRSLLTPDPQSPLIQELLARQQQYLNDHFGLADSDEALNVCEQLAEELDDRWQPQDADEVRQALERQFGGDEQGLLQALWQVDPSLVDCHNRHTKLLGAGRRPPRSLVGQFSGLMERREIDAAVEFIANPDLTEGQRRWFVGEMLNWGVEHYQAMQQGGVIVEAPSWTALPQRLYRHKALEALSAAGADLGDLDDKGRSLLFYVTERGDSQTMAALLELGVPFHSDASGQDPLHLQLTRAESARSAQEYLRQLDALMAWRPSVDRHHRSRMALMALRSPGLYDQVVLKYPQLAVDDTTPLPQSLCTDGFWY